MKVEVTIVDDAGNIYRGAAALQRASSPPPRQAIDSSEVGSKGLPSRILALRESGFFQEPRTPTEVHEALLESYHCVLNRVQMGLLRLLRRRELRRAIKKVGEQEQQAYVW